MSRQWCSFGTTKLRTSLWTSKLSTGLWNLELCHIFTGLNSGVLFGVGTCGPPSHPPTPLPKTLGLDPGCDEPKPGSSTPGSGSLIVTLALKTYASNNIGAYTIGTPQHHKVEIALRWVTRWYCYKELRQLIAPRFTAPKRNATPVV
jgi:hypothetical protein